MQTFSITDIDYENLDTIIKAFPLHDIGSEHLVGFIFDPPKGKIQGEIKVSSAVMIRYTNPKKKINPTLER